MPITNAALAQQVSDLLGKWGAHETELSTWASGTATGGPYADGRYPLTGPYGTILYLACPAAMDARVTGQTNSASSYAAAAQLSQAACDAAKLATFDARDLALVYKVAAESAMTSAQTAATASANSEANALVHEQNAGTSASAAATSATAAAQSTVDAQAARDTAATSASNASTSASQSASSASAAAASAATAQAAATGALHYRGAWDATTVFPAGPALGDLWKVSVAGDIYAVGDQIVYNGTGWDKIDNTEAVTSVAGRVGAVTLAVADVAGLQAGLDAKAPAASPMFTGTVTLPSAWGTQSIAAGTGDGASYTAYNVVVQGHWGIGYASYDSVVRGVYDTRTGTWDVKGGYKVDGNPILYRPNGADFNTAQGTLSTTLANGTATNNPNAWSAVVNIPAPGGRDGQFAWYYGGVGLPGNLYFRGWSDGGAWQNWSNVTLGVGGAGRIFVQSADPGTTAGDGDLWIW